MAEESNARKGILYGWKEISSYIGCSTQTAKLYAKKEKLPVKKISGRVLLSKAMVEKWLEKECGSGR